MTYGYPSELAAQRDEHLPGRCHAGREDRVERPANSSVQATGQDERIAGASSGQRAA
jgi:hypothetical protein